MENNTASLFNPDVFDSVRPISQPKIKPDKDRFAEMEKVLWLSLGARRQVVQPERVEEDVSRAGEAALGLVDRVGAVIRENEARAHAIAERAINELETARAQIKALEARVLRAEIRAKEAEKWLFRLNKSLQEQLQSFEESAESSGESERSAA